VIALSLGATGTQEHFGFRLLSCRPCERPFVLWGTETSGSAMKQSTANSEVRGVMEAVRQAVAAAYARDALIFELAPSLFVVGSSSLETWHVVP
jgi:hypothetical protein